ncbi:MAG: T9SS type A sorting domain-containing protein [Candidatus Micrarchaeota archaeon]|nr:T9SS type A sorting domain-containing protein [Candidatus Micrarchaeota archaeon]
MLKPKGVSVSQIVPAHKTLAKTAPTTDPIFDESISILKDPKSTEDQVASSIYFIRQNPQGVLDEMAKAIATRIKLYGDPKEYSFPPEGSDSYRNLNECIQLLEGMTGMLVFLQETNNILINSVLPLINTSTNEKYTPLCNSSIKIINNIFSVYSSDLPRYEPSEKLIDDLSSATIPIFNSPNVEDNTKSIIGGFICRWCFMNPEYADKPEFHSLFGLDSALINEMKSQSPETPYEKTYQKIYDISHRHPGEPIIKTLFQDTNITQFGNYPDEVIEHLYSDRGKATGKPIIFMVFTKRPWGVNFQNLAFKAADYKDFDIRAIEPGTDENMVAMMKETSARLGKKFSFLMINGHGQPRAVMMKRTAKLSVIPEALDVGDENLLNQMKPLLNDRCDVVLNACGTAQDIGSMNLAEFVAKTLGARCYGAKDETGGVTKIVFSADNTEITSVTFDVKTGVYDYRSTTGAKIMPKIDVFPAPLIKKTGLGYSIIAAGAAECAIYDMKGRAIMKLNRNKPDTFVWDTSRIAEGNYIARLIMENKKSKSLIIRVTK